MGFPFRFGNRSQISIASSVVDAIPNEYRTGRFELPFKLKVVRKQTHRSKPRNLPDPDASKDEVKFFLYQLLTFETFEVSRKWPQWVLETCAAWGKRYDGTGADLRTMSTWQLQNICPLDSNHAHIENKGRKDPLTSAPAPLCRFRIGEIVATEVNNLKKRAEERERLQQEWTQTRLGESGRRAVSAQKENSWENTSMRSGFNPYAPSYAQSMIDIREHPRSPLITSSAVNLHTNNLENSMKTYSTCANRSLYNVRSGYGHIEQVEPFRAELPAISSPSLGHKSSISSGITASTANTTPCGSIEDGMAQPPARIRRIPTASTLSRSQIPPVDVDSQEPPKQTQTQPQNRRHRFRINDDHFQQPIRQPVHSPHVDSQSSPIPALSKVSSDFTSSNRRYNLPPPRIIHLSPSHQQQTTYRYAQLRHTNCEPHEVAVTGHNSLPRSHSFTPLADRHSPLSPLILHHTLGTVYEASNRTPLDRSPTSFPVLAGNNNRLLSVPERDTRAVNFSRPMYLNRPETSYTPTHPSVLSPQSTLYGSEWSDRCPPEPDNGPFWQSAQTKAHSAIAASGGEQARSMMDGKMYREDVKSDRSTSGIPDSRRGNFRTLIDVIREKEASSGQKQRGWRP